MSKDDPNDKKNKDGKVPETWEEIFKHPRFEKLYGQKKEADETAKTAEEKFKVAEAELKKYKDAEEAAKQTILEKKGDYDAALKIASDKTEAAEAELKKNKDAYKVFEARTTFIQSKKESIPNEFIKEYVPQTSDEKELEVGWKKAVDRCKELKISEKTYPLGIDPDPSKKSDDPKGKDNRSPEECIVEKLKQRKLIKEK